MQWLHTQVAVAVAAAASAVYAGSASPMGTAFSYQGQLQEAGVPLEGVGVVALRFTLYDGPDASAQPVSDPFDVPDALFENGLFNVDLDFGVAPLDGSALWLEVAVGDQPEGPFTALSPRQPISGVPYALQTRGLFADELENIGIGSTEPLAKVQIKGRHESDKGQLLLVDQDHTSVSVEAAAALSGWGNDIASGTAGQLWIIGNDEDETDPGSNSRKDFKIANKRAGKLKFGTNNRKKDLVIDEDGKIGIGKDAPQSKLDINGDLAIDSPDSDPKLKFKRDSADKAEVWYDSQKKALRFKAENYIGGASENTVSDGVTGAAVHGGQAAAPNKVTDAFGVVGGGADNLAGDDAGSAVDSSHATVGGGLGNSAGRSYSTVGGGLANHSAAEGSTVAGGSVNEVSGSHGAISGGINNLAAGIESAIGGGYSNIAGGASSTVAGGGENAASGPMSAVGGGINNIASGPGATVPGGEFNVASGAYSVAMGNGAMALHDGAFVYADPTGSFFESTGLNQFLVRASGGIGINKNDPAPGALDVGGSGLFSGSVGIGTVNPITSLDIRTQDANSLVSIGSGAMNQNFYSGIDLYNGDTAIWGMGKDPESNFYIDEAGVTNRFKILNSSGHVGLGVSHPSHPLHLASGAHCTAGGTWTNASSREIKENFQPVDASEILAHVAALPIQRWNYKNEKGVDHIGPIAEDFYSAFQTGGTNAAISTVDADGVALAAIQALHEIVQDKSRRIAALEQRLAELQQLESPESSLPSIESRLARLEAALSRSGSKVE